MTNYVCIGAPYFLGERIAARTEVAAIKNSGFTESIGAEWVDLAPDFSGHDPIIAVNKALAKTISDHRGKIPIVFAADCTFSLGMIKGLENQSPAVLWYDAHGDFNTHETSPSGFLGGMPLAMLTGRGDMRYMDGLGLNPIADEDVIITDARDLDPEEAVMLAESGITHLKYVDDLLTTSLPGKPLYIHFDTDVVDIAELPGMSYPAPNGPSLQQAVNSLHHVTQNANVAAILFSLWNDSLPNGGKALAGTLRLARAFTTTP